MAKSMIDVMERKLRGSLIFPLPCRFGGESALPLVTSLDGVVLPGTVAQIRLFGEWSVNAVRRALDGDCKIIIAQFAVDDRRDPLRDDLIPVGVVAEVNKFSRDPDEDCVVAGVSAVHRVFIGDRRPVDGCVLLDNEYADVYPGDLTFGERLRDMTPVKVKAMMRMLRSSVRAFTGVMRRSSESLGHAMARIDDPGELADLVASNMSLPQKYMLFVLICVSPTDRLALVNEMITEELAILKAENELHKKTSESLEKEQRNAFLREQMRQISAELGGADPDEDSPEMDELDEDDLNLSRRIEELNAPDAVKQRLRKEYKRFRRMPPFTPDSSVQQLFLERCLDLPWGKYSKEKTDIAAARKVLDRDHYGLDKVKDRIIELLAARAVSPALKSQIICLVGPPGVGKTSIGRSIATATGRKYVRVSLGGVRDESEIRGHRRTYIGSMPGRIMNAVAEAKTANPLILLDEIDKLGSDFRGDPASALLEVLDGEQNFSFTDHYIDMPFDLSRVLFITTANDKDAIPEPLLDRMDIIELGSYTSNEKFQIAKRHLIPKQLKLHNLKRSNISINDEAIRELIDRYTSEAGVRQLERLISSLCRKESVRLSGGDTTPLKVKKDDLLGLLGHPKYKDDELAREPEVGLVNGLAWTSVGGATLQVEAAVLDGSGKLELTGSLGNVMKESCQAALSYIRSRSDALGLDKDFYKTKDIHLHFPEGAVPKDGPSAGITVTTALVSALTGKKVRSDIAMTGEITLRGRVLPIGGLREKSMAAYRHGLSAVIIPDGNMPDLDEVDEEVKQKLKFMPVKSEDEVLGIALADQ